MGNKPSRPRDDTCYECNCERVMPLVIKECCESVSNGAENTFLTAVDEMLGPNASLVTTALNENDWTTTFSGYVGNIRTQDATNIEPMSEKCKDLNYCDCDSAATNIIAQCKAGAEQAEDTIADIIKENSDIFVGMNNAANSVINNTVDAPPSTSLNTWVTKYFSSTRTNNVESYQDLGLYSFVRQSLESRHRAFKNTARFAEDCKNNATQSIRQFLTDEVNDLNKLYNYYLIFVNDHKTLTLDRGSNNDIISGKVSILENLQRKIDKYKASLHIDARKNIYLVSNYDLYKNIYFYFVIIYYSLFVLYLIFSKFIPEKQYTNRRHVLILFIYLIIPIILSYLMNLTYDAFIYSLEYYNMRDETQTYESLIEKIV
jgi:hypothetical protein|uniref:Uncharacterized protein n=1 Tax=viral metagenome TaxID=1070528 RepID=A0A6C0DXG3_9ZZZZ